MCMVVVAWYREKAGETKKAATSDMTWVTQTCPTAQQIVGLGVGSLSCCAINVRVSTAFLGDAQSRALLLHFSVAQRRRRR